MAKYFFSLAVCHYMKYLELLSPAKDFDHGKAAIDHGADALYIGAPSFGARSAAGNSILDIEKLVNYAHIFGSKVFATVNTILFDNELQEAQNMIRQLYNVGVDALIIQDLALLELELPPIALHASTQMHNIDPQRIKFLQDVGFQRVILARETSIDQMKAIRQATNVELESFVQGALCVSYSGQCYMSQYLNERSGNRGCCGQPCRSSYDLYGDNNQLLRRNEHLLSLKDFSATQHIGSMVDAGITSFKIEGRLKDLSYVKNLTAYYRQLLDNLMNNRTDCQPASQGTCQFFFTPDLSRTFNRGFTDYFLRQRHPMASTSTQKSMGKRLGPLTRKDKNSLTIKTSEQLTSGDGLCFFNSRNELVGFQVNHVSGNTILPNRMPDIEVGTIIWRNNDFAFEKQLQGKSSERKIPVQLLITPTDDGFSLSITTHHGISASASIQCEKNPARDLEKAADQQQRQLAKLGDTPFSAQGPLLNEPLPYFIPASQLNELRRRTTDNLIQTLIQHNHPSDIHITPNDTPYPQPTVDYRANVVNDLSQKFYQRHKSQVLESGLEVSHDYAGKNLMTTKYCLRYELGQCLLHKNNTTVSPEYQGNLYLRNNKNYFQLHFDCKECQMRITLKE